MDNLDRAVVDGEEGRLAGAPVDVPKQRPQQKGDRSATTQDCQLIQDAQQAARDDGIERNVTVKTRLPGLVQHFERLRNLLRALEERS